jgi:integrase
MVIQCKPLNNGQLQVELLDESGEPVAIVSAFLRHLAARDCSPNTLIAYAHDLQHLWRFLAEQGLSWEGFGPPQALALLEYLRTTPKRRPVQRLGLTLVTLADGEPATCLSAPTINRILAAVSSFYEYAMVSGQWDQPNPIEQRPDPALQRVADRHRPFVGGASRQRPVRRSVRVKTVRRLPRPLSDDQVTALLKALRCQRDRALVRLMLDGGLRPGEALGLHVADVAYGRRRVVIRHRNDHPKGARAKSRTERVVDLHEPATLETVSRYAMTERPAEATSPFLFLVGGRGRCRLEPLSYAALAKLFARACERAAIREPWLTPHSLRHTHATRMWEGGMRELTLQKRLGHASPESTRLYTRVSEPAVVADYRRALGMAAVSELTPDTPGERS